MTAFRQEGGNRHQRLAILLSNKLQKFRLKLRLFAYSKLCKPVLFLLSIYGKDKLLPDCERASLVTESIPEKMAAQKIVSSTFILKGWHTEPTFLSFIFFFLFLIIF